MKILVTGSTGFIGKEFISFIGKSKNVELVLLVREKSFQRAQNTFSQYKNISLMKGDLSESDILADLSDLNTLHEVESIVHLGAFYKLDGHQSEMYKHNIEGLKNILKLAKKIKKLKYFHHISSYVAGDLSQKLITPESISSDQNRLDYYANSKIEGEKVFLQFDLGLVHKRIYRPGVVISSVDAQNVSKVDGPYYITKLLRDYYSIFNLVTIIGYLPLPMSKKSHIPLVPVNKVAIWLERCVLFPTSDKVRTYHLLTDKKFFVSDIFKVLLKKSNLDIKPVPMWGRIFFKTIFKIFKVPSQIIEYMNDENDFSRENFLTDYPDSVECSYDEIVKSVTKDLKDKD